MTTISGGQIPNSSRACVGIYPCSWLSRLSRLLIALKHQTILRFTDLATANPDDLIGTLMVGSDLDVHIESVASVLFVCDKEPESADAISMDVRFANLDAVDSTLRGRVVRSVQLPTLVQKPGDIVLASNEDGPLWLMRGGRQIRESYCVAALSLLSDARGLHDLVNHGMFFSLVPIISWLRAVETEVYGVQSPAPRSTFLVDDPNLKRPTYGNIDFSSLGASARRHNYHVSVATVPLDLRSSSADVVTLFRHNTDVLSLCVHGNNHTRGEFVRNYPDGHCTRIAAQAMRRADRFSSRFQLNVDRIAVPPHTHISSEMVKGLYQTGFEGVTVNAQVCQDRLNSTTHLIGFGMCHFNECGYPVLARDYLTSDMHAVRLFMKQPIVYYFHHNDLKDGLGPLEELAVKINSLGQVTWTNLDSILRDNWVAYHRDKTAHVYLYTTRAEIRIDASVEQLVFHYPTAERQAVRAIRMDGQPLRLQENGGWGFAGSRYVPASKRTIGVELEFEGVSSPYAIPALWHGPWPRLRRFLTETRDRYQGAASSRVPGWGHTRQQLRS